MLFRRIAFAAVTFLLSGCANQTPAERSVPSHPPSIQGAQTTSSPITQGPGAMNRAVLGALIGSLGNGDGYLSREAEGADAGVLVGPIVAVIDGQHSQAPSLTSDASNSDTTSAEANPPNFEPWPPPRPTDSRDLNDLFLDHNKFRTLGSIQDYFVTALEHSGVYDFSYFDAPGGFALVTPLEQLNANGRPDLNSLKQPQSQNANDWFNNWITLLFLCPKGYYGAVVFLVTTDPQGPDMKESVTQADLENWSTGGIRGLTDSIRNESAANHYIYADVYDFEQSDKQQSVLLDSRIFSTDEQLAALGVIPKQ